MKIEKKELVYGLSGIVIILLWFLYLRNFIAPFLEGLSPFIAMLLYDFGLIIGLALLSSILNGDTKVKVKTGLIVFLLVLTIDIVSAPYLVSLDGMINNNVDMWYVSSDAGFGTLYLMFFPASMVWFLTYIVTPILLGVIIPILIGSSKDIYKALR